MQRNDSNLESEDEDEDEVEPAATVSERLGVGVVQHAYMGLRVARMHGYMHALIHIYIHTRARAHTHTHSHPHALTPSHTLSLPLCRRLSFSRPTKVTFRATRPALESPSERTPQPRL